MNAPTPSNRKLIIDIKHDSIKLEVLLNSLMQMKQNKKTAVLWCHLAFVAQKMKEVIILARYNKFVCMPEIVRTSLECIVTCKYFLNDFSEENILFPAWAEKLNVMNKILNESNAMYSKEELDIARESKEILTDKINKIKEFCKDIPAYEPNKVKERFIKVDMKKTYYSVYSLLSGMSHCGMSYLDESYTKIEEGQPQLTWLEVEMEDSNHLLSIAHDLIKMSLTIANELTKILHSLELPKE